MNVQWLYFHPVRTKMQNDARKVAVLATGGTIAGTAARAGDNIGYTAAQLGVQALVEAVPALREVALITEQVAQLDSKDMEFSIWAALAARVAHHLADDGVAGIVITHGTDTLEETAYLLQRLLAPAKPVVLAAAMRPATALLRDGPQNLLDAVTLAREPGARGVMAVLAGTVHSAWDVRKVHSYRVDAFGSGEAGPVARFEEGWVRRLRGWPAGEAIGLAVLDQPWPWVEIVTSHAAARGEVVRAMVAAGVKGIVLAGTGNGSVHHALEAALIEAQHAGVAVLRSTRCLDGPVQMKRGDELPSAGTLTPVQARIELMLQLMRA
ncbi:asparaginase [Rhizobacter sp. AJA081-3]|uniref:asparaginase n=1 Tax=Rhizobacter sp. AJA081-3 TaxID=2753607 RepID=UPI001FD7863D|nr:asparaginase [Rhizobacter sp. AJA081-3]